MASNKIQIKRSTANATVSGLSNGELAFTQASNTLWIGLPDGSGVLRIAGAQAPGVLTANQALVANSTSAIDKVIVANLVPTSIYANGSSGTAGQVLVSDGANVYWGTGTSGSNTQVQFNDSGVANATAGFTFDKTSNTLTVGNNIVVSGAVSSTNTTTGAITVAGGMGVAGRINVTDMAIGNDSVYTTVNNSVIGGNNVYATGTVNGSVLSVGGWVVANTSGVFTSGGVNADVITVGSDFKANSSGVYVANNVNATSFSGNGASITSVNAATVGGNTASDLRSYADDKAANAYSNATSYASTAAGTAYSNATSYADTKAGDAYSNAMSDTLSRSGSYTGNNTFGGTNTVISSNVTVSGLVSSNLMPSANNTYHIGNNSFRWAQVHAANVHAVSGNFDGNVQVAGDLIVSGNVTTVNVSSVIVSDPMIYLAGNNYSSDLVDIGFAANYYDGATARHTGLFRDASDGGIWKLFTNSEQELSGNNLVNTAAAGYSLAILQTYLQSGGLESNTSAVTITANSTVAVNITANTLTLSSPLVGTSGGTGLSSVGNNDILVGNSSNGYNKLSLGSAGYVLQSNGSALVYDTLDGGTF